MKRLYPSITIATAIAMAALQAPAAVAEAFDMAGFAYITCDELRTKNTESHFKGVAEMRGIFVADDDSNPATGSIIEMDNSYYIEKRDDVPYAERGGAYGTGTLSDPGGEYLIISYVRSRTAEAKWTVDGGSGKFAAAAGKGNISMERIQTCAFKATFSGVLTLQ